MDILPACLSSSTFIELFHTILDLPLISAALFMVKNGVGDTGSSSSMMGGGVSESEYGGMGSGSMAPGSVGGGGGGSWSGPYRVLYNYLLRNEGGVPVNWWSSPTTRSIINAFCHEVQVTWRVREVMERVPALLSQYFAVLTQYGDEGSLLKVIPVVFERIDQLFPSNAYQEAIRELLVQRLLAVFERYPAALVILKVYILEVINDRQRNAAYDDLVLHLCWAIGEYCSPNLVPECTVDVLSEYDDALELFAFERMSLGTSGPSPTSDESTFENMLMSILLSSLTKLAARWPPLISRVSLCLEKMERYQSVFHPAVMTRASECLRILRYPSIAAAILDAHHHTSLPRTHVDLDSSLPFVLRTPDQDLDTFAFV